MKKIVFFLVGAITLTLFLFNVPNKAAEKTVAIYGISSIGTGVYLNEYEILTNHHVVSGTPMDLENGWGIETVTGAKSFAKIVYTSDKLDFAILRIDKKIPNNLQTKISCTTPFFRGASYFTIGHPLNYLPWSYHRLDFGGYDENFDVENLGKHMMVMTNATVNPGNSGGGVFDFLGNQIGIVTAIIPIQIDLPFIGPQTLGNRGGVFAVSMSDVCEELDRNEIKYNTGLSMDVILYKINYLFNKLSIGVQQYEL